ncbi:MAG: metal-dependent hydrolase [Steroidobacteraceae bacterium]
MRPHGRPAPLQPLPDATFRRLVVVSLTVGSNLPDVDLLYTSFARGPLAYVLHHRGYTHTLVGALAGAVLLWLAVLSWLRFRHLRASTVAQAWIAAACVGGVLLHLAMDYTNNYGVHPFWPFYNGWVYGDSVFIVEPLLWLAAAPLIFILESRWARLLVALAVGVMMLGVSVFGLVATPAAIVFVLVGMAMLAAGRWLRPGVALGCGIALWLGVTALFAVAGRLATVQLDAAAAREFPDSRTLDRVLTPSPADPVCWDAWLVQAQGAGETMRQARVSLLPGLIGVGNCRGVDLVAAGGEPVRAAGNSGLQWLRQFSMPADRIAKLALTQCSARAFMQFARVPMAQAEGSGWWLGDLRFGGGRGFSWLQLSEPAQRCDFWGAPWLPPRPELLAPTP